MRLIRVMCSGRVDLSFVFRAFSRGLDGVFIGGCRLNECNYSTQGNYHALGMTLLCKKIMEEIGLNPERLTIQFMSGAEATLFVEAVNGFITKVKELGEIGAGEVRDDKDLRFKLEAVTRLIPYIKLVERERLRVPVHSEEAYRRFFTGEEFNRLFKELIADPLAISQLMALLQDRPLSPGEIAESLVLDPSEVSRHLHVSARHGLVRFDEDRNLVLRA